MLTSPRITGEWRNAVCDRLAPGEELVALSDILSYSWYSDGWGNIWAMSVAASWL